MSIQSAHEMIPQPSDNIKKVALLRAPAAAVEEHRQQKSIEWKSVSCVPGIQSLHVWMCAHDQLSGHACPLQELSLAR